MGVHGTEPPGMVEARNSSVADSAAFKDAFYSAPDGLKLHARIYGSAHEGALPVVCLPGLTRNARDFHDLALICPAIRQDRAASLRSITAVADSLPTIPTGKTIRCRSRPAISSPG